MSILKKIIFVVVFVILTLFVPAVILLLFVDATEQFAGYVLTYIGIIFAVFGYIIASMRSMSKELSDAVEEMKKQNAAIAYKLLGYADEEIKDISETVKEVEKSKASKKADYTKNETENADTSTINLNPAEPLEFNKKSDDVIEDNKSDNSQSDDGFDDFK